MKSTRLIYIIVCILLTSSSFAYLNEDEKKLKKQVGDYYSKLLKQFAKGQISRYLDTELLTRPEIQTKIDRYLLSKKEFRKQVMLPIWVSKPEKYNNPYSRDGKLDTGLMHDLLMENINVILEAEKIRRQLRQQIAMTNLVTTQNEESIQQRVDQAVKDALKACEEKKKASSPSPSKEKKRKHLPATVGALAVLGILLALFIWKRTR